MRWQKDNVWSDIGRWGMMAVLAGSAVAAGPLSGRAESLASLQGSAGYSLADALIPYAQRDYVRAVKLLTPLAERGNAVAQLKLGIIYSRGKLNSRDHVAALRWFTEAAENGQVEAQFELGRIYRDGRGVNLDGKLAAYWFERAAQKDTVHAINALGELYLGYQGISQNFATARRWFLHGAQLGNAASMYNIGVLYSRGQGVMQDDIEAFKWFALAASMAVGQEREKALHARALLAERLTPMEVLWGEGRAEAWCLAHLAISGQ